MTAATVLVRLTWQPVDSPGPETLTAELPAKHVEEMRELIGTEEWTSSEGVMWIACRARDGEPMERRLFRLARILDVQPC